MKTFVVHLKQNFASLFVLLENKSKTNYLIDGVERIENKWEVNRLLIRNCKYIFLKNEDKCQN